MLDHWDQWVEFREQHIVPNGWAFCSFPVRDYGSPVIGFVCGIVRGRFGIWRKEHALWDKRIADEPQDQPAMQIKMAHVVHLPSGVGIASTVDLDQALAICEALKMVGDESFNCEDQRLVGALTFHGFARSALMLFQDDLGAWQSPVLYDDVGQGRPAKVS